MSNLCQHLYHYLKLFRTRLDTSSNEQKCNALIFSRYRFGCGVCKNCLAVMSETGVSFSPDSCLFSCLSPFFVYTNEKNQKCAKMFALAGGGMKSFS